MFAAVAFYMHLFQDDEDDDEDWDEEDTEEEEEDVRIGRELRDKSDILEMPDQEFVSIFRMDKHCFKHLLKEGAPWMNAASATSTSIPPILKLSYFLSFIAVGSYQEAGNEYMPPMSQENLYKNICECLEIFEDHLCPKWIRFEMSGNEEAAIKEKFLNRFGIPGVIGCVACTHIQIKDPGDLRHLYYNRRRKFSINALMVIDFDLIIRYVDARSPGGNNDSFVWRTTLADECLKEKYNSGKRNSWLLGHKGYKLVPYLMTPYKKPQLHHEITYNTKVCTALTLVERFLEALNNRFPCTIRQRCLNYSPIMVTKIINACSAMHNILIFFKNGWEVTKEVVPKTTYSNEEDMPSTAAAAIRDKLAKSISD